MTEDQAPTIEDFEGWANKTALKYTEPTNADYPDIVQELRIGIWIGMQSFESGRVNNPDDNFSEHDAYVGWVTRRAEWHLQKLFRSQRWTGLPSRSGTPLAEYDTRSSYLFSTLSRRASDENKNETEYIEEWVGLAKPDPRLDSVEISAYLPDIVKAINTLTLPERNYAYHVFWNDAVAGKVVQGRYRTKDNALMKLSQRLDHLRSLVVDEG